MSGFNIYAGAGGKGTQPNKDRRTVLNGAGGAGDCGVKLTAAAGGEFEPVAIRITNQDTVARDVEIALFDSADALLFTLFSESGVAAGGTRTWPNALAANELRQLLGGRLSVFDGCYIKAICKAVALSQDVDVVAIWRHTGDPPTITEVKAA